MRTEHKYIIGACLALLTGLLLGLYLRGLFTISFGTPAHYIANSSLTKSAVKKQGKLFFWNKGKWNHESTEILLSNNPTEFITHIVNKWLTLLEEEGLMAKRVMVSHVLMNGAGNEIYISFDRYPFNKENSCYEKLMWVEGLLKTLRDNDSVITHINFKVRHTPLQDYHLNFSSPWPLQGFLSGQN